MARSPRQRGVRRSAQLVWFRRLLVLGATCLPVGETACLLLDEQKTAAAQQSGQDWRGNGMLPLSQAIPPPTADPVFVPRYDVPYHALPPTNYADGPLPEFPVPPRRSNEAFYQAQAPAHPPIVPGSAAGPWPETPWPGTVYFEGQDAPALPPPDASLYGPPLIAEPEPISDYKKGFFQKLELIQTYVPRGEDDGLGWSRTDLRLSVAVPAPSIEWPLLITPGFTVYFTDGPDFTDIPSQLYEATLQLTWVPKLNERTRLILSVTPGVYGDFQQTDSRGRRIMGLGLVAYDWKPDRLQLVGGVVYLDRDDFNILPAIGLIWTPHPDLKVEAVMPRPRAGWRWRYGSGFEDWIYLAGEIGGGTWQIERADLTDDRVTVRDFRVVLGAERKRDGGAGYRLEVGYGFGREIEFRSDDSSFDLPGALLLRAGVSF